MTEYGWEGARAVWVRCKSETGRYTFVCVYVPVDRKVLQRGNKKEKFQKKLN